MNIRRSLYRSTGLVSVLLASATLTQAQGLGGLLPGQGAAQNQTQQRVQQQVQTQVQQRVQAQVQNQVRAQVQGQVQQRIQSQVAGGVQARLNGQIQARANQAVRLAARARATAASASQANVDANVNTNISVNATPGVQSRTNASAGLNASTRSSRRPVTVTQTDIEVFDSIFGQFNPLRSGSVVLASAESSSHGSSATAQESEEANPFVRPNRSKRNNGEAVENTNSQDTAQQRRENTNTSVVGILSANADFGAMISVAARQRRAEIAQMRDQAIASASAELLAQADAMENQLDAFAAAQQQAATHAQARSNGTVSTAADNVSARGNIRANANIQSDNSARLNANSQAATASAASNTNGSATVR
ncbi:hypothetical protein [Stieleria varia]|uniref:Secreted protein n=1 Tax=Stieleria varia TaxID=2528005 RepID=A0A5C6A6E0_9BACT|nr:hypothetical protein [Stieleria varia]TWT94631.1 hypothetical protein Pla52n_54520 [Stieleria varia]